jgi:hypothetical protein
MLHGRTFFCERHDEVHQYMREWASLTHAGLSVRFSIKKGCMSPPRGFPADRDGCMKPAKADYERGSHT